MKYLNAPITEVIFIDFFKKKFTGDDEHWFEFLQDIFFIGTEEKGLVQIYCLPDLEI